MKETLHLLVVDDEMGMRLSVERALRNYTTWFEDIEAEVSYRITMADTGEAALDLLQADPRRHPAAGLQAAGHLRAGRAADPRRAQVGDPGGDDHRLRQPGDGGAGHQGGRLRLPRQAVQPRRAQGRRAQDFQALHGPARGAQAGRGAAPDPVRIPFGAGPRAEVAPGRGGGQPADPCATVRWARSWRTTTTSWAAP